EAARVDLRALLEERLDLFVDREVSGERGLADAWVAARAGGEQHARAVQDDVHVEALAYQAGRREQVDQCHRALVGNGVDEDEGLLTWLGLDVREDLLIRVVQSLAFVRDSGRDRLRHGSSSFEQRSMFWWSASRATLHSGARRLRRFGPVLAMAARHG